MIVDELRKDVVIEYLKTGRRIDGRALDEYRPIVVEKNVISSAEGSARVRIGKTLVLVGVKVDAVIPFKDRPDEGVLSVSAELLPMASPTFEPGPPNEDAIELARIVDRGIRSAEAVDLKSLFIEEEKVWGVYVDIFVLDHDGNLIDAAGLATVAALDELKIPKYVDGTVVREPSMILKLKEKPLYFTYSKIGDKILTDASYVEELATDARLTISVTDKHVVAMQKGGSGAFTRDEVISLIENSFKKREKLLTYLE